MIKINKMKKIHIMSVLAVSGIILFIGIAVPKLTVRDAVSLTAEEKSCVQTSMRQQFDYPLQRIALWLGKSAVIYKQGDGVIKENALIVKSYTIFRIPLPGTRFFNRFAQQVICDGASERTDGVFSEAAEFTETIQSFIIKNISQPIEGFSAYVYLQAFPVLLEADFDGVETLEGKYAYKNGKLNFVRRQSRHMSSAGDVIIEKGHKTLFNNIRGRLGNDFSVNEIIKEITAQGIGRVSGTIMLGPICPIVKNPPDPKCIDKPIFGEFIVQNAIGSIEFARFSTAENGSFSISLPAGEHYITWAEPLGPGIQGRLVNVIAGETSEHTIVFNAGMR